MRGHVHVQYVSEINISRTNTLEVGFDDISDEHKCIKSGKRNKNKGWNKHLQYWIYCGCSDHPSGPRSSGPGWLKSSYESLPPVTGEALVPETEACGGTAAGQSVYLKLKE